MEAGQQEGVMNVQPKKAEYDAVFEEKLSLAPSLFSGTITGFDDILLDKLKNKLEGKCSRHGFVIPNSLELLSRSMGIAEKGRFTGEFIYFVKAQGKVYNPPDGLEEEGEVFLKNKMGLLVVLYDAIRVMIPRDLHIGNETFDAVEKGDRIRFIIRQSKFQINDKYILSIGEFKEIVGAQEAAAEAPALLEENEEFQQLIGEGAGEGAAGEGAAGEGGEEGAAAEAGEGSEEEEEGAGDDEEEDENLRAFEEEIAKGEAPPA